MNNSGLNSTNLKLQPILENLNLLEKDTTVPKAIRDKIKSTIILLTDNNQNTDLSIRISQSLEELSEIADDPALLPYAKMQIWSIVSQLESK